MSFDPCQRNIPVQQISNPARRGLTTGRCRQSGTRTFAQVEFWSQERDYIPVDDLKPLRIASNDVGELLAEKQFGKKGDLARILTFHKISSNLSNVFYAMQASRTDFYAYQFKPVYKFVESLRGRLLVTDEVGLGKTIEAGLIWLEARARSDARRLLVVCPPMLREKWKQELRFRFDVKAELYDSAAMLRLIEDFRREVDNFQCAAICSLPSIRNKRVQEALADLEQSPCRFDLVVIDEAHYMRNVKTQSHKAGKLLSDLTEAMLLLTATPLHLKNEDLFRQLNILDADEFDSKALFELRVQENEPVVRAQNALRQIPPDIEAAREHVTALTSSKWFAENPLTHLATKKLNDLDAWNHSKLVEIGRLLEDLNLLAATVSRTRKREVQEWRVLRQPAVFDSQFNAAEMSFYIAVTKAVRERLRHSHASLAPAFGLMMPQVQMASCIPAMVEHYRQNPIKSAELDEELLQEFGLEIDEEDDETAAEGIPNLQSLIDNWDPETPDTKFDALADGLARLFKNDYSEKVVIFSYFRKTLSYLQRRLREAGYHPVVIHGQVPMPERLELIDKFKNNPSIQVLLSSEVGSEGIDLQFCRLLVNYDLPWNPMKVEQRIGRLDRLGQKAEKITIVNFAIKDTIEERILQRLYDRIGIFKHSIGDLEPILGSEVQELTFDLLSKTLTPEQEEERIIQTQMAVEAKQQQEAQLVDQSTVLFGSSDYILQQIGEARDLGRWITPEDLRSFVEDFFDNAYKGTRLRWNEPGQGLMTVDLSNEARNEFAHFFKMQTPPPPPSRLTHAGHGAVVLAVESDAAQEHPSAEVLSHFHPLVRWIIDCHRNNDHAFSPTAAVEVSSDLLQAGDYVCAIEFWTFHGVRKEVQIAYAISSLSDGQPIPSISGERLIREMLDRGRTWEFASRVVDSAMMSKSWQTCVEQLSASREDAFNTFEQKNLATTQRRKAHLESYGRRKEESILQAIATSQQRGLAESRIRGFQTQLSNHRASIQTRLRELEKENKTRQEFREVAGVVCHVVN